MRLLAAQQGRAANRDPLPAEKPEGCPERQENEHHGQKLLHLFLSVKIRNAHADGVFDDHDLSKTDQRSTDPDVDVLAR